MLSPKWIDGLKSSWCPAERVLEVAIFLMELLDNLVKFTRAAPEL